jgi:hypothetical protein
MQRFSELLTASDPVEFARERLGFEPDEAQAAVLRSGARRLILNCTRQWGKSTLTAAKAVHRAWTEAGSTVLVTSPSERQSAELVRKARGFVSMLDVKARGDGSNKCSLLLPNGSRIIGLPSDESKVRGFSSVSLLVIDEAARAPEDLYKAMRPVLAVSGGDLWLMSTPYGRRGFFWDAWSRGGPAWTRVSVPATECARIPAEFLAEEREAHTEDWYRQEYLCEFVQEHESLIDRELLEAALTDDFGPLWRE